MTNAEAIEIVLAELSAISAQLREHGDVALALSQIAGVREILGMNGPTHGVDRAIKFEDLMVACHQASIKAGWHTDLKTGARLERNRAEMLALIHSEVSEALEGERKQLMDTHLPHRPMAEVEMADVVIRVFDYCGHCGYDLLGAILEKMAFNAVRADHKIENRKSGGKLF